MIKTLSRMLPAFTVGLIFAALPAQAGYEDSTSREARFPEVIWRAGLPASSATWTPPGNISSRLCAMIQQCGAA